MKKGVVIGGGIAGLVSASILASRGYEITLLEKQKTLGGKLQDIQLGDYQFDFGPSTITMPWIFERVFHEAGKPIDPKLCFIPLAVNSRNFFYNGTVIDLSADPDYMSEQLAKFSAENRRGFLDYLLEVQRMYERVHDHFFANPIVEWQDMFSPRMIKALLSVRPFQSMDAFHRQYFDDPRLLAMMNRFASYVGSSPYLTPATLSILSYLELVQCVYYTEGGNYRLIESLERLARDVGVQIHTDSPIDEILIEDKKVTGVRTATAIWPADFVISNVDIRTTREKLLPKRKIKEQTLSLSGYLCLLGIKRKYNHLHHHNLFFPENNGRESIDLFDQQKWPLQPTVYICNSSFTEPNRAKAGVGTNLYMRIYVPSNRNNISFDEHQYEKYKEHVIQWLEKHWGFEGLNQSIEEAKMFGPTEIEQMSGAWKGAIYGQASHRVRALFRPPVKEQKFDGLYYAGATTHPGGGTATAAISGMNIAQIIQWEKKTHP